MIKSKNILSTYIKEQIQKSNMTLLFRQIPVTVIGNINQNISVPIIIKSIESILIKDTFVKNIENIYFGDFKFLADRSIQALYSDECIYVSTFNGKENITNEVVLKDILHEIGHSLEESLGNLLYSGEMNLEEEYLRKKKSLLVKLISQGYKYNNIEEYTSSEYSKEFDKFLYSEVGYVIIENMISGIFMSPYSATSLSEYFANGFEEYLYGDQLDLKQVCPTLYNKLKYIISKKMKSN